MTNGESPVKTAFLDILDGDVDLQFLNRHNGFGVTRSFLQKKQFSDKSLLIDCIPETFSKQIVLFANSRNFRKLIASCLNFQDQSVRCNAPIFLFFIFYFFFLTQVQTPVTLCSGEWWSILVVRLAHSADLRSQLRHVSSAPSVYEHS